MRGWRRLGMAGPEQARRSEWGAEAAGLALVAVAGLIDWLRLFEFIWGVVASGNENAEVQIHRYVTEGSFDAYMWQLTGQS